MKAFRIVQWNSAHETAESRKYKSLFWVATPNKHDGAGFRRIVRSPNREGLFAAWNLILQVASKGPPGMRGWLVRGGRPLSADDLSLMTGFRKTTFEKALLFFSMTEMGWLVEEEFSSAAGESSGTPGESPGGAGESSGTPLIQNRTEHDRTEGEKKNGAAVVASKVQFAALRAQIKEMELREAELSADERKELRKKKAALAELQKKQAEGKF